MNREWKTVSRVGFLGKDKDQRQQEWNDAYGKGNWRLSWQLRDGTEVDFDFCFRKYVESYAGYLRTNPMEAEWLATNASYTYDKDLIDRVTAFQPRALVDVPGVPNQFHHVALNLAMEEEMKISFRGTEPLQVREGKKGMPEELKPKGYRFSPGRIQCIDPGLIPFDADETNRWWGPESMEALYQNSKVLQIRQL